MVTYVDVFDDTLKIGESVVISILDVTCSSSSDEASNNSSLEHFDGVVGV